MALIEFDVCWLGISQINFCVHSFLPAALSKQHQLTQRPHENHLMEGVNAAKIRPPWDTAEDSLLLMCSQTPLIDIVPLA